MAFSPLLESFVVPQFQSTVPPEYSALRGGLPDLERQAINGHGSSSYHFNGSGVSAYESLAVGMGLERSYVPLRNSPPVTLVKCSNPLSL